MAWSPVYVSRCGRTAALGVRCEYLGLLLIAAGSASVFGLPDLVDAALVFRLVSWFFPVFCGTLSLSLHKKKSLPVKEGSIAWLASVAPWKV